MPSPGQCPSSEGAASQLLLWCCPLLRAPGAWGPEKERRQIVSCLCLGRCLVLLPPPHFCSSSWCSGPGGQNSSVTSGTFFFFSVLSFPFPHQEKYLEKTHTGLIPLFLQRNIFFSPFPFVSVKMSGLKANELFNLNNNL